MIQNVHPFLLIREKNVQPQLTQPLRKTPEGLTFDDGANTYHIRPRSSIALEVLETDRDLQGGPLQNGLKQMGNGGYNPYKWRYGPLLTTGRGPLCAFH